MNWIVTVKYDPGIPKQYQVLNAPTSDDAKDCVLRYIGYHPGVPLSAVSAKGKPLPTMGLILRWRSLSSEEKELIRYND